MKTPAKQPCVRTSVRALTITVALALGVGSLFAASPGWPPSKSNHPGRPLRPVCNIPNCVEVKPPFNPKLGPNIIRCEIGKACHPQCSRHCS